MRASRLGHLGRRELLVADLLDERRLRPCGRSFAGIAAAAGVGVARSCRDDGSGIRRDDEFVRRDSIIRAACSSHGLSSQSPTITVREILTEIQPALHAERPLTKDNRRHRSRAQDSDPRRGRPAAPLGAARRPRPRGRSTAPDRRRLFRHRRDGRPRRGSDLAHSLIGHRLRQSSNPLHDVSGEWTIFALATEPRNWPTDLLTPRGRLDLSCQIADSIFAGWPISLKKSDCFVSPILRALSTRSCPTDRGGPSRMHLGLTQIALSTFTGATKDDRTSRRWIFDGPRIATFPTESARSGRHTHLLNSRPPVSPISKAVRSSPTSGRPA